MRADLVVGLLQQHEGLKVIHFVRDPRGIVLSRRSAGLLSFLSSRNLVKESKFLCERITHDLSILDTVAKVFPKQFLTVRYEDLTADQEAITHLVYDFIDQDIPAEVTSWFNNTMSGTKNTGLFGTQRANSTYTAYRWRDKLPQKDIDSINGYCSEVLQHYGYQP